MRSIILFKIYYKNKGKKNSCLSFILHNKLGLKVHVNFVSLIYSMLTQNYRKTIRAIKRSRHSYAILKIFFILFLFYLSSFAFGIKVSTVITYNSHLTNARCKTENILTAKCNLRTICKDLPVVWQLFSCFYFFLNFKLHVESFEKQKKKKKNTFASNQFLNTVT